MHTIHLLNQVFSKSKGGETFDCVKLKLFGLEE